ncbi:MAG: sugar phosphate isomerase/epimerase family protein [Acetanaerobacterium sp.]
MKLAFSTLGCPGWTFEEIFSTAKDLGLDGIEIRGIGGELFAPKARPFLAEHIGETRQKFARSGMCIPMLSTGACLGKQEGVQAAVAEAKAYADLAAALGTSFIRVMITSVPQPTDDADLNTARDAYEEICRYAGEKGVVPLIETNGPLASSPVMKAFMQSIESENKGVLWDIHHPFRYFGEQPADTYAQIGEYVRYIHVKDSAMANGAVQYRMMGYGDVPIFDTLRVLGQNGYDGFVTFEWVKRWCPDLQEPGIVFSHFASYMGYLLRQL